MKLELLVHNLGEQTRAMSSVHSMQRTAAYKELLANGQGAVPVLLLALHAKLAVIPVMALLQEITSDSPVLPEDAGVVEKMRAAWLAWGRMQKAGVKPALQNR